MVRGDEEPQPVRPNGFVFDPCKAHDVGAHEVAALAPIFVHGIVGTEPVVRGLDPFVGLTRPRLVDRFLATIVAHGAPVVIVMRGGRRHLTGGQRLGPNAERRIWFGRS
jgi:hypothetical protein